MSEFNKAIGGGGIRLASPPRMRGIKAALAEVRQADPNTALTERALRRMVLSGELPSVRIGTKYLLNLDLLFGYLSGTSVSAATAEAPAIRRIPG